MVTLIGFFYMNFYEQPIFVAIPSIKILYLTDDILLIER